MDKYCNWVYLVENDPTMPDGILFLYMSEVPIDVFGFMETLKAVIEKPLPEFCHHFTNLFTRYDKAPDLNAVTDEPEG